MTPPRETANLPRLRKLLLDWYGRNQRDLPWRRTRDPYAIWVSEIMLQQTRVAVVEERYKAFLQRFPSVASLALAPEQDVLALWSGLGYYRRARMLHKAAQFVTGNLGGTLPNTAEGLRELPGIGAYTAAAIASIAHGEPIAVVDGNVERVLCRVAGWDAAETKTAGALRKEIERLANELVHTKLPGDFNQAMMELGATVCTPRSPQCLLCPIAEFCQTRGEHKTAPRPQMKSREVAHGLCVRANRKTGSEELLLEQRPLENTVMPGMWELPALSTAVVPEEDLCMTVRHAIMQVNYSVRIRTLNEKQISSCTIKNGERRWVALDKAHELPLTGLTRKVLTRAHLLSM